MKAGCPGAAGSMVSGAIEGTVSGAAGSTFPGVTEGIVSGAAGATVPSCTPGSVGCEASGAIVTSGTTEGSCSGNTAELWVAALQKGSELAVFPVPPLLPALQKELYPALQVYPLLPVSGLPVDH